TISNLKGDKNREPRRGTPTENREQRTTDYELRTNSMQLSIPALSLIVLVGPSGSGKSTFARSQFLPTEVISSDFCRGLVADDENDQAASDDAFAVLHFIAAKRLERMKLVVVDATNVQTSARKPLIA